MRDFGVDEELTNLAIFSHYYFQIKVGLITVMRMLMGFVFMIFFFYLQELYIFYLLSKANALDCVTRTYRLLHQKIQRDYLYECFKEGERGCRALLNNIREENLSFFYEVMEKYKQYDKTG